MMSFPSCLPCQRGAPKSSVYETLAMTGKMSRGTAALAVPAKAPVARRIRRAAAVVRWRLMGERSDAPVHAWKRRETSKALGRHV